MKHSESIKNIAPALLSAQKMIGGAKKEATNPFFKSSYADLGSVMEACKDALNENGITVLQPVGNGVLETVLMHTSGEWISEEMNIVSKSDNNPQDHGSAITYARRYSLQSMVFIPAEDDDREKAVGRTISSQTVATPLFANTDSATDKQVDGVKRRLSLYYGYKNPDLQAKFLEKYGVTSTMGNLTKTKASEIIGVLEDMIQAKSTPKQSTDEEILQEWEQQGLEIESN